jgi:glycosyltransferase involved in cell wall biosynthesis
MFWDCSVLRSIEKPIRIRFQHTRYPHWGEHSGYALFVHQLDPHRFRSSVHASPDRETALPRWLKPAKPLLNRLVARAGMPWYRLNDLRAEMNAIAAGMAGRFDIVHFLDGEHCGRFLPLALKKAGRVRVKTVATFHQPPELAKEVIHLESLRWFDQVVLISPSQLPFFGEHVEKERLNVILHGVDTDFFRPASRSSDSDRLRCITVGHWLRDWETFSAVAAGLPDVQFDVVADRPLGIPHLSNVGIHRGIDDLELAKLYRDAHVLFLPLVQSTANNALLEGMASGLAVVATDLEAVRAYVPDGDGLLVPGTSDDFVQAIRTLQHNSALREDLGRRARMRAETLAWSRIVAGYETLYSKVARR